MAIRCVGRRYPNAPAEARGGCLERPPPWWFAPIPSGLTGATWVPLNGAFQLCPYQSTPKGIDPSSFWFKQVGPVVGYGIAIETIIIGGVWRLQCSFTEQIFIGGNETSRLRTWKRDFPSGFPVWPNSYDLTFEADINGWPHGGDSPLAVYIMYYSQLPVGSCL